MISEHFKSLSKTSQINSEHLRVSENVSDLLRALQRVSGLFRASYKFSQLFKMCQSVRATQSILDCLRSFLGSLEHLKTS